MELKLFYGGAMMRTNIFWVVVLAVGFLSGCAQMSPIASTLNAEKLGANQHFIDPNNHDVFAKHHEDAANEMKAKLQAQKELLKEYEEHNYYYGRKGQDLQSHTLANIRYFENSIKENLKEAAIHRKMARDQEKRDLGLITE
ncbi:hypothetical protein [Nitrosomonas sp. Nm33]|uniref:hypothetical protein n=1 Tax=Nitrosomonas sp. Nm33 TaxID=133724 RepID=UPI00089DA767|nr:hypothetical protein [Nitrosomonas sp. Nm33]SDY82300.1 hypothetical protein SAMN05421755_10526 [Nitrosomonas sp. Nm33]